ncbi:MAG: NAD kinase [Bacteroidia bacterium]|nr:NAD kinase [Bacteroidia bacterium]
MKLAILGRWTDRTDLGVLRDFFQFLEAQGIQFRIHHDYAGELLERDPKLKDWIDSRVFSEQSTLKNCDFAFSFGGDGTLLNTVRFVGPTEVPILGVNFGRLGFLTNTLQENLQSTTLELVKGMFRIDSRVAMSVESDPKGLFGNTNYGLNDLTIHKSSSNEMITVHTYINGEFLNSYWGDGLIIATPTGSTAYSLSCGGPIIHPNADAFVITPVAPHSLTVRPVLIPDSYVISFEIESRAGQAMVAMDTRTELVNEKTEIAIRKADFRVNLVRTISSNYLDNLRERMMWGKDRRN